MTEIIKIKQEIDSQLANKEVLNALVATTFKGLQPEVMKKAILEGMMRGFQFKDFLEKNVYAIPFSGGYSLVTSIDYARKIGMRSGVVGTSAPTYEEKDGQIISCTVTVKRKVDDYVGEYSATVFFNEYNTKKNQWVTKPRTMIAKVAEMHALRKACPEALSQSYSEDEMGEIKTIEAETLDVEPYKAKLESAKNLDEVKNIWASLPIEAKKMLESLKETLKQKYANA